MLTYFKKHKLLRIYCALLRLHSLLKVDGQSKCSNYKALFNSRLLKCSRDICGVWLPGICRRPIWPNNDKLEKLLAANVNVAAICAESQGMMANTNHTVNWK